MSFYSSEVYEDILICAGASYFTAAFNSDFYLPEKAMGVIRIAALCIMAVCWWWLSFFNGLRRRKSFAVMAGVFHLLPPAMILLINSFKTLKFSDLGILAGEIAKIISLFPYSEPENALGICGIYFSAAMAGICLMLFTAGYIYTCNLFKDE